MSAKPTAPRSPVTARASTATDPGGLTYKQRNLVNAICAAAEAGRTITIREAGTLAGYGEGETARSSASRALSLPVVRKALIEATRDIAAMDAPSAFLTLRHVRQTAKAPGTRLNAAIASLKFGGMAMEEVPAGGGGVVIQLMLQGAGGTLLTQPVAGTQIIEHKQADSVGEQCLVEGALGGEVARKPRRAKASAGQEGGRGAGGAISARAAIVRGANPQISAPEMPVGGTEGVSQKISRSRKSRDA